MCKGGGLYDDSGQTYRVATSSDINTLDSTLATDTVSFTIYNQVYEGLYSLNGKDECQALAKGKPKNQMVIKHGQLNYVKMRNGQMVIL